MDIVNAQTIWQCGMQNVGVSTDGGRTWTNLEDKAGGMGCILAFAGTDYGWLGFGDEFEITKDGGNTWETMVLPKGVNEVAAISLRSEKAGYILDDNAVLHITQDGGQTWTSKPMGIDNPDILGFGPGEFGDFVNETPQAAVRFFNDSHGFVILGLSGRDRMAAFRTMDGGNTWLEEPLPENMETKLGTPYISLNGNVVAVHRWNEGLTLIKYE